jgi:glycosyltransferase involved in cell wall biosynthesis
MKQVLGFTRGTGWDALDGPQYYRSYLPLREMNRAANGIEAHIVSHDDIENATDEVLSGRDVYMMARMYNENIEPVMDLVHSWGAKFVLDSDDDLTDTYRLVSGRGEEFKKVLSMVDHVTVSTQPLADLFSQWSQEPPTVLPNHVDTSWMLSVASQAKRAFNGFSIGFSGSPTHWQDWYLPAAPLQRIAREYDVVPIVHGEGPRYLNYLGDNTIYLGGVPFAVYPMLLAQFDAVLCAVDHQDDFNTGKSNVKALECLSIGVLPVCSQFPPYAQLRDEGAPVIIIEEESRDGWYEAMRWVVENQEQAKALAATGMAWVKERYDMCHTGHTLWSSFYDGIIDA